MSIAPLSFRGASSFSSDLQQILNRAVAIAKLPLTTLQNEQADLISKKQLLTSLRGGAAGVSAALADLGSVAANQSLTASSSDATKVGIELYSNAKPGFYTLSDVTSIAKAASATSTLGYESAATSDVSGAGNYLQLAVGATTYDLNLTDATDNLTAIRDQINALGAGVTASLLNTGTGATPNFLTITANSTGAKAIELRTVKDSAATNILTATSAGSDAQFKINGQSVVRDTNVITGLIEGARVSLTEEAVGGGPYVLSLTSGRAPLTKALSGLVSSYNALVGQVDQQIGTGAGLLSGASIIREMQDAMRKLTTATGSGAVANLAQLGVTLDTGGKMSFDGSVVDGLTTDQLSSAFAFINDAVTGLGAAKSSFTQISDPFSGLIVLEQQGIDGSDKRITGQVNALTERITLMQSSMLLQLQQADALLSQLEGRKSMISASVDSLNLVLYGKKES